MFVDCEVQHCNVYGVRDFETGECIYHYSLWTRETIRSISVIAESCYSSCKAYMKINTPLSWFICSLFKWKFKAIPNIRMTHSPHCAFNRATSALYFAVSSLIMAAQQTGEGQHVEGKVRPRTGHEGPEGEKRYSSTFSLTSVLDWRGWSTSRPGCFTPKKEPVHVEQEAGWAPGPAWTGAERVIRVNSALHYEEP
jgi:hypothetical protein